MSDWAGLEAETWGLQKAWVNLQGDAAGMAAYAYERMSAYQGENHPAVCANLIQRLIGVVAGNPAADKDHSDIARRGLVDKDKRLVDKDKRSRGAMTTRKPYSPPRIFPLFVVDEAPRKEESPVPRSRRASSISSPG